MGTTDARIRVPARIHNWILEKNLGSGYSGSIWRATNPFTGQVAAVKIQDVDHECPTNRFERNFYPSLQGGRGMPTLWASGVQGDYDYLVIDVLGPSLDNLYRQNGRKFDIWTTICIAMQVIDRLEFMHSRGILHRDIQLGNCVVGLGPDAGTVYMIDFGFSKRYINAGKHIPDSKAKRDFIGNYWFSSVNVHCRGKVPSRRDDMEALALMLIHVLTDGGLPWTRNGIPKSDKQHDVLIRKKLRTTPDELCQGLPPVFEEFLRYCRRLKFLDQPNYGHWKERFADLARERDFLAADGTVKDDFVWPPRPIKERETRPAPQRSRSAGQAGGKGDVSVEDILAELVKLRLEETDESADPLEERQKRNVKSNSDESPAAPSSQGKPNAKAPSRTIIISSSDESDPSSRAVGRSSKQAAMRLLTRQLQAATDNAQLGVILRRFVGTLQVNRSKVITKEAFDFLGALNKQLGDPSVFVGGESQKQKDWKGGNTTTVQTRSSDDSHRRRQRPQLAPKTETVKSLRTKLEAATTANNAELARLVDGFVAAVRTTSGKTLTKDGAAFLEGVAEHLDPAKEKAEWTKS